VSDEVPAAYEPELVDTPQAGPAALRGSAVRAGGYVVGLLLGLVSAPLLIRHLGIVDFGRYMTVVSVVGLVAVLTEGGLNAIAQREYGRTRGAERALAMRDMLGMRVVLTTVGVLIAVAFSAGAGYDSTMVIGTAGAAAALLLHGVQLFLGVGLQGDLRFGWATLTELVRQAVSVAAIVVLVLAGAGLVPLLWVPLVATAVSLAMAAILVRGRMPLRPAFSWVRWRPVLLDTLPYAIAIAVGVAYFRAAMLIVSLVSSDVETGYFAMSFRVIEILIGLPTLILGAAYPILVRSAAEDQDRFGRAVRRTLELSMVLGSFLALITALAAPFVIAILAGAEFDPSVSVLRIQALALAANFVGVAAGYGLLSAGRNRAILAANAIGLTATVVLNLALAPSMGAEGAAIATSVAEWVLTAALLVALLRTAPHLGRALAVLPVVALAAAPGAALLLVPGLPSVIATIAGATLFVAVLAVLGHFPSEVREMLHSRRLSSGE
jgi:O-antigen/teichoic acid export membrane protein